jgi:hypothetical protein
MAFADPQSITFSGSALSFPRTSFGTNSGAFTSTDGVKKLSISHSYGKRTRRLIRLDDSNFIDDELITGLAVKATMSAYLVVDVPVYGYSPTDAKSITDGFLAYLTASSGAKMAQFLGGEA